MKFKTIYSGERALVTNLNGEIKIVDGPTRIFVVFDKVEKLKSYKANNNEYLIVKTLNGDIKHIKGPAFEWFDRTQYESIRVENLFKLIESQIIIVYRRLVNNEVERRLVQGPCVFMPEPNEWLHNFNWHGEDPTTIGKVLPNLNKFQILSLQPGFFHYNVNEVRTSDDTLLTIKLTLIYKLNDIYKMLDCTQDPISDFINAICADIVSFVGKYTFSEFLLNSNGLNNLENYSQLNQRSSRIGYTLSSIIYNGYHSSDALQAIQDNAIQKRTEIRLQSEVDLHNQEIANLKLKCEAERFKLQSDLTRLKIDFSNQINALNSKYSLEINAINFENEKILKDKEETEKQNFKKKENKVQLSHFDDLKKLGIDINTYLLESNKAENKIDKRYDFL